jgi:hypothetical protein
MRREALLVDASSPRDACHEQLAGVERSVEFLNPNNTRIDRNYKCTTSQCVSDVGSVGAGLESPATPLQSINNVQHDLLK